MNNQLRHALLLLTILCIIWGDTKNGYAANTAIVRIENKDIYTGFCQTTGSISSKNNSTSFSGDTDIATSKLYVVRTSCMGVTSWDIPLLNEEDHLIDYETGGGFCANLFSGNKIILSVLGEGFGNPEDRFDISATILTEGVYFKDTDGAALIGETSSGSFCVSADYPFPNTTFDITPEFIMTPIPNETKYFEISTTGGTISGIDGFNALYFNLPPMSYDPDKVQFGTELQVQVTFTQFPVDQIFSETTTLGTFVDQCFTDQRPLFFPYLPGKTGTDSWGGFVITNSGNYYRSYHDTIESGTAELTFTDSDGNVATYETPVIPPKGQWNSSALSVEDLTPVSGVFDGTKSYSVKAVCNFSGSGASVIGDNTQLSTYLVYTDHDVYNHPFPRMRLNFPFFPGTQKPEWQGEFIITNTSDQPGTATLIYADEEGNTATYTTEEIPANGQWASHSISFADLTPEQGNFDPGKNYSVDAWCTFEKGGGFAMIGNAHSTASYTPYSNSW